MVTVLQVPNLIPKIILIYKFDTWLFIKTTKLSSNRILQNRKDELYYLDLIKTSTSDTKFISPTIIFLVLN